MHAGATGVPGRRSRRAADSEHADSAVGGQADIAESRHAGEIPAAASLDAVGDAAAGLAVDAAGADGRRVFSAGANPLHARSAWPMGDA